MGSKWMGYLPVILFFGVYKLAGANETMREVLALTEVGALCELFDDVTTAVRSFS